MAHQSLELGDRTPITHHTRQLSNFDAPNSVSMLLAVSIAALVIIELELKRAGLERPNDRVAN